ncbi:MAG: spore germination protein [Clostridiales bacterium]|nr:spore germination protein [Clostridiales bacterium]
MIENANAEELKSEIGEIFKDCGDLNSRTVFSGNKKVYAFNFGNYSGRDYISENIIKPLTMYNGKLEKDVDFYACVSASEAKEVSGAADIKRNLLSGFCVIFAQSGNDVISLAFSARNEVSRSPKEPDNEIVVRGPREGFAEKAEDNVALIRKRIKSEKLKVLTVNAGKYTDTGIKILYLKGVADERLVNDVKNRIENMKIPSVMDSGYVEQYLAGGKSKLFTEIGNSEKPDKVASKITEGRIAILVDSSPVALTVPYLFTESLQSAEDYLKTPYYATFIRILRFISLLISLYLPAFYVAVMEHHKNAVPAKLYLKMTESRADVPFGIFGEMVVILLIFELIREVGIRMPGAVGSAVSIVGGLILGDAAISAGISSPPIIMVASLTAICTFILPTYMNSTLLLRLVNLSAAMAFGTLGIASSLAVILSVLSCKTSFGVPYMLPFAPVDKEGAYDSLLVLPKKAIKHSEKELKY